MLRHNDPRTELRFRFPASTTKPDSAIKYCGQRGVFSHLCLCPNRMSILLGIRYEYRYHWYHCEDLRHVSKSPFSNNPPCQNCNFSSPMSLCPAWLWQLTMSFQRCKHDAWCKACSSVCSISLSRPSLVDNTCTAKLRSKDLNTKQAVRFIRAAGLAPCFNLLVCSRLQEVRWSQACHENHRNWIWGANYSQSESFGLAFIHRIHALHLHCISI